MWTILNINLHCAHVALLVCGIEFISLGIHTSPTSIIIFCVTLSVNHKVDSANRFCSYNMHQIQYKYSKIYLKQPSATWNFQVVFIEPLLLSEYYFYFHFAYMCMFKSWKMSYHACGLHTIDNNEWLLYEKLLLFDTFIENASLINHNQSMQCFTMNWHLNSCD